MRRLNLESGSSSFCNSLQKGEVEGKGNKGKGNKGKKGKGEHGKGKGQGEGKVSGEVSPAVGPQPWTALINS